MPYSPQRHTDYLSTICSVDYLRFKSQQGPYLNIKICKHYNTFTRLVTLIAQLASSPPTCFYILQCWGRGPVSNVCCSYKTILFSYHRFVSMMPTPALFLVFSFLPRIVEGVGTALFSTASYAQLSQFYPDKKGTIVVSGTASRSTFSPVPFRL